MRTMKSAEACTHYEQVRLTGTMRGRRPLSVVDADSASAAHNSTTADVRGSWIDDGNIRPVMINCRQIKIRNRRVISTDTRI